jgi:hypothetical protein
MSFRRRTPNFEGEQLADTFISRTCEKLSCDRIRVTLYGSYSIKRDLQHFSRKS